MIVNGTLVKLEEELTVEQYLQREKYTLTRIAVERNGEIIPKSKYNQVTLSNEDRIEIVHFVGGG